MSEQAAREVSQLLVDWSDGDEEALAELMPRVYKELRSIAAGYLRRERAGHTLQTSALVNEAYLRLIDQNRVRWRNRTHFFAIAAQMMRRILVDHARRRSVRGGEAGKISFDEVALVSAERAPEVIAVDEALSALEAIDPEQARVVELRYFGGLDRREIAEAMGMSVPTVSRRWRLARAWLYRELQGDRHGA